MASVWDNPEVVDRLKILWLDRSANEIAGILWNEFRISASRNAVIGRLHRMKLTATDKREVHRSTPRDARAKPQKPPRIRYVSEKPTFVSEIIQLRCAEVVPLHIALMDLEPNNCRWPYGDDPTSMTFCGAEVETDRPYCSPHCGIAYHAPKPRDGQRAKMPINLSGHGSNMSRTFAA